MEKLKSWPLWLAIGSLIVWIVKTVTAGTVDIGNEVEQALNLILPICIGFGIINNPDDRAKL